MKKAEVIIDLPLVQRLVNKQFPQWTDLTIKPVESKGKLVAVIDYGQLAMGDPACDKILCSIINEFNYGRN